MMNKASCLSLLSNAVLVANTAAIDTVMRQSPEAKKLILKTDVAQITPSPFHRIIPDQNGIYVASKGVHQEVRVRNTSCTHPRPGFFCAFSKLRHHPLPSYLPTPPPQRCTGVGSANREWVGRILKQNMRGGGGWFKSL